MKVFCTGYSAEVKDMRIHLSVEFHAENGIKIEEVATASHAVMNPIIDHFAAACSSAEYEGPSLYDLLTGRVTMPAETLRVLDDPIALPSTPLRLAGPVDEFGGREPKEFK